jgi:1-acyl-sn-glycerol-3-phosphate acyltransferase
MSDTLRRERMLEVLVDLLGLSPAALEPTATLAEVGVDSLTFAELAAAVAERGGPDLGAAQVSERSTVADLLAAADAASPSAGGRPGPRPGRLQPMADLAGGRALAWWFDLVVTGREHVPTVGPAIVAMNHESALDIPIAVIASPRPIVFMAKDELFKNAFVSWALMALGGFRVDRARFDLDAVRLALAVLERGEVLGMYPEGTRSPGVLGPFLDGAAWLALRLGVPIVPCAVAGTDRVRRARLPRGVGVRVTFAEPIEVARVGDARRRRAAAAELTARVRASIAARLGLP